MNPYQNVETPCSIRCPEDHVFLMSPIEWRRKRVCPVCTRENNEFEEFTELLDSLGFQLMGTFKGMKSKVTMKCPEGHEFERVAKTMVERRSCTVCVREEQIRGHRDRFQNKLIEDGFSLVECESQTT